MYYIKIIFKDGSTTFLDEPSEDEALSIASTILKEGYNYKDEVGGLITMYPPSSINKIEVYKKE